MSTNHVSINEAKPTHTDSANARAYVSARRGGLMKVAICLVGTIICAAYMCQSMITPQVIESILLKRYDVDNPDSEIIGKTARIQSILDGTQCLLFVFLAPAMAKISDVYGRKFAIFAICISGTLSFGLMGISYYYFWLWGLYISRVIGCLFMFALILTTCLTYMSDLSSKENKTQNFGYALGSLALGMSIAPTLIGLLISKSSHAFVVLSVGCAILLTAMCVVAFLLPESIHYNSNLRGRSLPPVKDLFNPFNTLGILFRTSSFVSWMGAAYFIYYMADSAIIYTMLLYSMYRYNWNMLVVGLVSSANGVSMIICQGPVLGIITRHLGERKAVIMGMSVGVIANVLFGLAAEGWMFVVGEVLCGYAVTANSSMQALVSHNSPREHHAVLISALMSLGALAQFAGNQIASNMFAYFISEHAAIHHLPGAHFFLAAVLYLLCIVLCAVLFTKHKEDEVPTILTTREEKPLLT